jgi:hypothetical protein
MYSQWYLGYSWESKILYAIHIVFYLHSILLIIVFFLSSGLINFFHFMLFCFPFNIWSCELRSLFSLTYCFWVLCFSYLELAIFPCWRFLVDQPLDSLQRLVMMARGVVDPLASAYCRLYMAHCARKLPLSDIGICFCLISEVAYCHSYAIFRVWNIIRFQVTKCVVLCSGFGTPFSGFM